MHWTKVASALEGLRGERSHQTIQITACRDRHATGCERVKVCLFVPGRTPDDRGISIDRPVIDLLSMRGTARHDKAVNIANILYHTYTYRRVSETTLPGPVGGRFLANVLFSVKIRLSFCKCLIFR